MWGKVAECHVTMLGPTICSLVQTACVLSSTVAKGGNCISLAGGLIPKILHCYGCQLAADHLRGQKRNAIRM